MEISWDFPLWLCMFVECSILPGIALVVNSFLAARGEPLGKPNGSTPNTGSTRRSIECQLSEPEPLRYRDGGWFRVVPEAEIAYRNISSIYPEALCKALCISSAHLGL